jgi:hypothetical protein
MYKVKELPQDREMPQNAQSPRSASKCPNYAKCPKPKALAKDRAVSQNGPNSACEPPSDHIQPKMPKDSISGQKQPEMSQDAPIHPTMLFMCGFGPNRAVLVRTVRFPFLLARIVKFGSGRSLFVFVRPEPFGFCVFRPGPSGFEPTELPDTAWQSLGSAR